MQAPSKSQLKQPLIGAGIEHNDRLPPFGDANSWLMYPWVRGNMDAPGPLKTVGIALLTFVGALTNGWIVMTAIGIALNATQSATASADLLVRALIIGLVQGGYFWIVRSWTYDSSLHHYVYPENAFGAFLSHEIGLIPFLGVAGLLFGGYAAAGGILTVFGNTPVIGLVNGAGVGVSASNKAVYWFVGSILCFYYVYNTKFFNNDGGRETSADKYQRTIAVYAAGLVVNVIFLSLISIVTFSSGLYVTAVIATNGLANHNLDWAFWVFVSFLACPATAALLYYIFYFLDLGEKRGIGKMRRSGDEYQEMEATSANVSSSTSSAVNRRRGLKCEIP